MASIIYLLAFVVVIGVLVVVHEGGHFLVARCCGVMVSEFSIGFGKILWSRTDKKGTVWKICVIPLGGYVKMLGDADASSSTTDTTEISPELMDKTFIKQPVWKKACIIAAGPGVNYLFAVLLLTGLIFFVGEMNVPPVVGAVLENSAAEEAGLQPKDRILEINGKQVTGYQEIVRAVQVKGYNQPVDVLVRRVGQDDFTVSVTPKIDETDTPRLGIVAPTDIEIINTDFGLWDSFKRALTQVKNLTVDTMVYLKQIFLDHRSVKGLRGPVGIAEVAGDALRAGALVFLVVLAHFSVAIGFCNLLPILPLDGGHLLMYAIQGVFRRPVPDKVQTGIMWVGFLFLIGVFLLTLGMDIPRVIQRIVE